MISICGETSGSPSSVAWSSRRNYKWPQFSHFVFIQIWIISAESISIWPKIPAYVRLSSPSSGERFNSTHFNDAVHLWRSVCSSHNKMMCLISINIILFPSNWIWRMLSVESTCKSNVRGYCRKPNQPQHRFFKKLKFFSCFHFIQIRFECVHCFLVLEKWKEMRKLP